MHTSLTSLSDVAGRTMTLIKTGNDRLAQTAVQTASSIAENVGDFIRFCTWRRNHATSQNNT